MQAQWLDTNEPIDADHLNQQGVYYRALPPSQQQAQPELDALMKANGYVEQDIVALQPDTPDLNALCAKFVDEHMHDDDEVRFVLEGEGVFDIRSTDDRYMRVRVQPGDLIVVPRQRHHRFMLTEEKTIRCVRLFRDQGGWVPHYREGSAG